MSAQAIHLLPIHRCSYFLMDSLRPTYLACLLGEWLRLYNEIREMVIKFATVEWRVYYVFIWLRFGDCFRFDSY